jgi:hypothetical protein
MRAARTASVAAALALVALVTACGGGSSKQAAPSSTPTSPAPLSKAAQDLQRYAAASRDSQFVAVYAAETTGKNAATVGVWVQSASSYRVDVQQGAVTASLFATPQGSIACTRAAGQVPACFLVAKPGAAIPTQFDAGVQRIFTRDLPQLAADPSAFDVSETTALPATKGLAAAQCFAIKAVDTNSPLTNSLVADVDLGTYCLSMSGPPRKLTFGSGTLTLSQMLGRPTAAQFVPPAAARPLPATASPPATTTPLISPNPAG